MLIQVIAVEYNPRLIRIPTGRNEPIGLKCNDGLHYICKPEPRHGYIGMITEVIATELASACRLSVHTIASVIVPLGFIALLPPRIGNRFQSNNIPVIGSRYIAGMSDDTELHKNLSYRYIAEILVFDTIIGNEDRTHDNLLSNGKNYWLIDHEYAFDRLLRGELSQIKRPENHVFCEYGRELSGEKRKKYHQAISDSIDVVLNKIELYDFNQLYQIVPLNWDEDEQRFGTINTITKYLKSLTQDKDKTKSQILGVLL